MKRLMLGVILAALSVFPAAAGEIADKAQTAEALAADGKFIDAMDTLGDAQALIWDRSPLAFRQVLWVTDRAGGFGVYNPRTTNAFTAGEPMVAYVEPVGFGWKRAGEMWQTDLSADVSIKTKDGKELYAQKDFQKLALSSRVRNREFMTQFTYTLAGLPSGEYVVDTTFRDGITGKTGTFTLTFVIE